MFEDSVVFLAHTLRIERPDLVLSGITEDLLVLDRVYEVSCLEPVGGNPYVRVAEYFDTQMVKALVGIWIFVEYELERRLIDGEIRVAGFSLVDPRH